VLVLVGVGVDVLVAVGSGVGEGVIRACWVCACTVDSQPTGVGGSPPQLESNPRPIAIRIAALVNLTALRLCIFIVSMSNHTKSVRTLGRPSNTWLHVLAAFQEGFLTARRQYITIMLPNLRLINVAEELSSWPARAAHFSYLG
jgi:hypothetical protein